MRNRKIPFMRVTNKIVRFSWPAVEAALAAYELKAVTAKAREARTGKGS
jgi:hypothetical protein